MRPYRIQVLPDIDVAPRGNSPCALAVSAPISQPSVPIRDQWMGVGFPRRVGNHRPEKSLYTSWAVKRYIWRGFLIPVGEQILSGSGGTSTSGRGLLYPDGGVSTSCGAVSTCPARLFVPEVLELYCALKASILSWNFIFPGRRWFYKTQPTQLVSDQQMWSGSYTVRGAVDTGIAAFVPNWSKL